MSGEEAALLDSSFQKVRHACKIIKIVCFVATIVFAGAGVLLFLSLLLGDGGFQVLNTINAGVYVLGSSCIALLSMLFFSDIERGTSPFSKKQIWRLRGVALCFALFALADAIFSPVFFGDIAVGTSTVMFVHDEDPGLQATLDVNIMTVIMALLTLFFSIAFEYAGLLQANVDETL